MTASSLADRNPMSFASPSTEPLRERILRNLVPFATFAPSGHNTQPWRFRVRDDALELWADEARALPAVDPDGRALVISCGAALGVIRTVLRHDGYAGAVELLPDAHDPGLLARVRLGEPIQVTTADEMLFHAIPRRHTDRRPFDGRPVPPRISRDLTETAEAEDAWLRVVTTPAEKQAVAELVAEGDRRQAADPAFRRELAAWMRPNHTHSHDGMPGYALGFGEAASVVMPLVVRALDWGRQRATADQRLALDSPALVVLGTRFDSRADWLRAGQAVGRLLLRATVAGLSASFLNQPIEVAALRPALARTLAVPGVPQLLLRVGYGSTAARPTPRRAASEVLHD